MTGAECSDRSVLLIDDDSAVRDALAQLLEQSGYGISVAPDGRRGLQLLRKSPFRLLLLDLELPGISGWDLLDYTSTHWPLMPVVVLTGFSSQCVPGSLLGVDAFFEKPPDVSNLLKTISALMAEPLAARLQRRGATTAPGEAGFNRLIGNYRLCD